MRYQERLKTHVVPDSLRTGYENNRLTLKGRYMVQYELNIYDVCVGT